MCGYCGCSNSETATPDHASHQHGHGHSHEHDNGHNHAHEHHHHDHDDANRVIELSRAVLDKNDRLAERARGLFMGKGIAAVNLVSSPGSGKTSLLAKTATALGGIRAAVVVGDCATDNDARRLRDAGTRAVQVTTGSVCHLDAHMLLHAVETLPLNELDLLFIENVGNLVCPAAFDLGEDLRIVLISVTEGEDKSKKYPTIFHRADAVVVTKTDLSEAVGFDRETALSNIRDVASGARIFEVSAKTGSGMEEWIAYLMECVTRKKASAL